MAIMIFKNNLNIWLAGIVLVLSTLQTAEAAVIGNALEEAMQSDGEIPVIINFIKKVDLNRYKGNGNARSILRTALVRALKANAHLSQSAAIGLLKQRGVKRIGQLWAINGLAATLDEKTIRILVRLPTVESITLDATINAPEPDPEAAITANEWHLNVIRANELWTQGFSGSGTVVAGMDTGVDLNHPDIKNRWRGGTNSWFDPNSEHSTPYDANGHGTQTMGLMVGGNTGGTNIGTAPGAQWIAVKIFNDNNVASLSGIHLGFQWLLDPDGNPATDDATDVVNNSWGFPNISGQCYTEFELDIDTLKAADIGVVFSAGNTGINESPANNDGSFAVGSVDENLNTTDFSARGPSACNGETFPHVVAPGENLRTADLTFGGLFPYTYTVASGTSFSAALVSGAIALLRSANPGKNVTTIESALQDGTVDIGFSGPDPESGFGLIDLPEAHYILTNASTPLCTDTDIDGFFGEADCGTLPDCNDDDNTVNPAACDIKSDGIDQDCDGKDRTKGKSCPVSGDDGNTGGKGGGKDKKNR